MTTDASTETTEPSDDDAFVPLSPRRPPTEMSTGPSEAVNLVSLLKGMEDDKKRQVLKYMADTVIRDYDADVRSRSRRMKKIDKFQKLYASITKTKSFPFQNCANVNLPFLTYPCLQVHARLYDMVVPANGKIFFCSPTNAADVERAGLTEKFGNSYIRHKMDSFATSMDESLLQVVIYGSAFRRTYWNQYQDRVCSDFIPIEDFVVAYWQKSVDPSLRDVPRYTMVQHLTIFDLEDYGAQGIYENVEGIKADDSESDKGDEQIRDTVNRVDGVEPDDDTSPEDKPRMVLEQHRRWRMPNKPKLHPDFDGRPHAVIVTVDERSRRVLRVVVREEDDPDDLARFNREQEAFDQHVGALDAHLQEARAANDSAVIAAKVGIPAPPQEPMKPPPEPPPGVEVDEGGNPLPPLGPKRREIAFFTHYKCFPGEGFYGHGFGDFLAPLNEAANTILNQHIDGVTLTNARPGFISRQMRGQRGTINVQPGVLVEVDAPMGSIKDSVHWLDPPKADPSTMGLIELMQEMSEKFGGNDVMSGQPSGSNQTARGTMILNENALAQLSVLSRRVKEAEKHELDKIWRCWGVFLSDEEIDADIVDENGVPGTIKISRQLFIPDARVQPVSDVRMRSQKVEETQATYAMALQNPLMMQNPAALLAVTEDMLRAMDANKIIPMIQPPPQQGPPPPEPHWQEDANFLRGQDQPVNPLDDDETHIAGHMAFRNTPPGQALDKNAAEMHDRHIRGHMANRLEKKAKDLQNMLGRKPPGSNDGGPGGAAPLPMVAS